MTYEYKCRECGHEFYVDKPMGAAVKSATCPECGCEAARVYAAPPVHFKGEGFTCACAESCEGCDGTG